jgi:nucleoside-diphosphate-sugar epimerase
MILITGGTGLLGTHLILALHQQGIRPRAIYRNSIPEIIKDKAAWVQGDILDVIALEEAMQDIQHVYHVAGFVSFSPKHRAIMNKINVEGTANVVNACLEAGIKKLVHVSSVSALGRLRTDGPITESMQWTEETSNSEYGRTKYLAELEVFRGIGEGLCAVMVNPTIIIGEHGDWTKGSMNIFRNIYYGFKWYTTGSTGFADANDVARAMIQLMDSDIHTQRFIISAENVSYQSLFNMVADAFNVKRPSAKVTPLIANLVWRLEYLKSLITKKDPLITRETAKTGMANVVFDNSKFLKAFPDFQYTPLQKSVARIAAYLAKKHS